MESLSVRSMRRAATHVVSGANRRAANPRAKQSPLFRNQERRRQYPGKRRLAEASSSSSSRMDLWNTLTRIRHGSNLSQPDKEMEKLETDHLFMTASQNTTKTPEAPFRTITRRTSSSPPRRTFTTLIGNDTRPDANEGLGDLYGNTPHLQMSSVPVRNSWWTQLSATGTGENSVLATSLKIQSRTSPK